MHYVFDCPKCHNKIEIRYLKIGEVAQCKSCGERVPVPESAREVPDNSPSIILSSRSSNRQDRVQDGGPKDDPGILQINIGKSAWSPKGFKWIAFFFTFFPAMMLAAYNWERLGQPDRKRRLIILAAVLFPVWLVFIWISDQIEHQKLVNTLLGILNFAIGSYLGTAQMPTFIKFIKTGGKKRGYGRPIVSSLAFGAALLVVLFGWAFYQDTVMAERFDAGRKALDENKYVEAREILANLTDYYADEPAVYYNLALAYEGLEIIDSAAHWYLAGQRIAPFDNDFKIALTYIAEYYKWHPADGSQSTWYESGIKKSECSYLNGLLSGPSTEYWPNGSRRQLIEFDEGTLHGKFELWDSLGNQIAEGHCQDGQYHGPIITWHPEIESSDTVAIFDQGMLMSGTQWDGLELQQD